MIKWHKRNKNYNTHRIENVFYKIFKDGFGDKLDPGIKYEYVDRIRLRGYSPKSERELIFTVYDSLEILTKHISNKKRKRPYPNIYFITTYYDNWMRKGVIISRYFVPLDKNIEEKLRNLLENFITNIDYEQVYI